MTSIMDSLEARKMFAVDFSVTLNSSGITGTLTSGGKTKYTASVTIANVADNLPKGVKLPNIEVSLRSNTGSDLVLGTAKVPVLKAGKSKTVKVKYTIPATVTAGNYSFAALFSDTVAGDTNPANDSAVSETATTVSGSGTSTGANPFAKYNLGDKITFTKTGEGEGHGIAGAVHELGNFTDNAGHSGTYDYAAGLGLGGLNFEFDQSTNTPDFFITSTKLKTLKGTYTVSSDSAKAVMTFKDVNTNEVFYLKK